MAEICQASVAKEALVTFMLKLDLLSDPETRELEIWLAEQEESAIFKAEKEFFKAAQKFVIQYVLEISDVL